MNNPRQKSPYSIALLMLIGTAAVLFVFWQITQPLAASESGIMISITLAVFFISYTWALILYLRQRDHNHILVDQPLQPAPVGEAGTVYGLVPGSVYRVMQPFTDHYGNSFAQDELLRFKERHFLPYHGGHTVIFEERTLYLQEDDNRDILDNFSAYIAPGDS